MRATIEKLAYKLCSTEVKMLIDKIEEHSALLGYARKQGVVRTSKQFDLMAISESGSFTLAERIALSLQSSRIYRCNTKVAILTRIMESSVSENEAGYALIKGAIGVGSAQYVPGETIATRRVNEQLTAEKLRQQGLL